MRVTLGLATEEAGDGELITALLERMAADRVDYTILFRRLADFRLEDGRAGSHLRDLFVDREAFDAWARRYAARLEREGSVDGQRAARMKRVNPKYVLRNHLAQAAIEQAETRRDYTEIDRLLELLRDPYAEQPAMTRYAAEPPGWARDIELSCSS
jgi:uncharacterized protein YdiU (UPF0061 family)